MQKKKKILLGLIVIFAVLLGTTLFVSFSSNIDEQEIVIKSMTPVYDETSGVVVSDEGVVFNDKNQVVKYNVVLENTQDYDVKISDIKLSTPTEAFLKYEVEELEDDVLKANTTKELVVSFETTGIKGWGRNFADELTANISFEKYVKQEEPTPPVEEDNKQEELPKAPATNIEELTSKTEKIELTSITNNVIEFKKDIKVEEGQKVAVWIYSEPKFLGCFDIVETDGIKQIVGLEEALKKAEVNPGEHNIVLATEDGEALGYIEVYVSENNTLSQEKPEDITNKEESNTGGNVITKPSTDSNNKDNEEENDEKVENPYTSDKGLLVVLVIATGITGLAIVLVSKNKFTKYSVLIIMLSSTFNFTNAEEIIDLPLKFSISFESQNTILKSQPCEWVGSDDEGYEVCESFWNYKRTIKKIYIENDFREITDYAYKFDISEEENGRAFAYLVANKEDSTYYDLYLQSDGIMYLPSDSSNFFADMYYLESINNIEGLETSNVTDMSNMFSYTGHNSTNFTLDVSNFDTSKVTDMSHMFFYTGFPSANYTLDVSKFDTSNVTNMNAMFMGAGYTNPNFTLDVSNFDTSNVTNMAGMFHLTGYTNPNFTLDVSNFDTSNVTDMARMFANTGYNSTKLNISITIKNPDVDVTHTNIFDRAATKEGSQIKVNYTSKTSSLVDELIIDSTRTECLEEDWATDECILYGKSNVVKGDLIEIVTDDIDVGDEIPIGEEKFNVISQTDDTVTMLAQYNLGTDYKQTEEQNYVAFSDRDGWEYEPGPKEIDIQTWSTNPKTYVNAYVEYIKKELDDDSVTGNLITLKELKSLGCNVRDDYSTFEGKEYCGRSYTPYNIWLVNGQAWWTRSAYSGNSKIWFVGISGKTGFSSYDDDSYMGIRPTITISKDTLKNLN